MVSICKLWIELDNDLGIYEYCAETREAVMCCGYLQQCPFPNLFEGEEVSE